MPELPEVETTRQGLLPHMMGKKIMRVVVRDARLRWPVPANFAASLTGLTVTAITRRGKYLLWECRDGKTSGGGFVLSHLGMSGTLRVMLAATAVQKHDHVDVDLESGATIRFNDPRRFGAMLWIAGDSPIHPLLAVLGPEPLSDAFTALHLFDLSRGRSVSIKEFIMNGHIVVGVGNIYA